MTASDKRSEYWARVNRAIDHIERHLAGPLPLTEVARVACFSPFHFHRIFHALVGEPLSQFVQRVRLERAAGQLRSSPRRPVTRIALECGYSSSAAFARAFRAAYGMSATEWRRREAGAKMRKNGTTGSKPGQAGTHHLRHGEQAAESSVPDTLMRRKAMNARTKLDVRVEELPEWSVAYVRHIGPYQGDAELFRGLFERLTRWAGPRDLLRFPATQILIVYHDDPDITAESRLRTSVCITVPPETLGSQDVGIMRLPGGRYARVHFELAPSEYAQAWDAVYGEWLPESGYQPDDRPPFELYLNNPQEHPEGKAILDICVPVKPL